MIFIEVINFLSKFQQVRAMSTFLEFFEISRHSFDNPTEITKPMENYILKRSNSRQGSILSTIFCCFRFWQKRWFVLKDDMIFYLDSASSDLAKDVKFFNLIFLDFLVRSKCRDNKRL